MIVAINLCETYTLLICITKIRQVLKSIINYIAKQYNEY